ncbi:hypothetical protein ACFQ3X_33800 [Plantactinospora endophytica]
MVRPDRLGNAMPRKRRGGAARNGQPPSHRLCPYVGERCLAGTFGDKRSAVEADG